MTGPRGWAHDLLLGARLAVNGRGELARLALVSIGVGMGVAVLLLTGSLAPADDARNAREDARQVQSVPPERSDEQEASLLARYGGTQFRGEQVPGLLLDPVAPDPPLPPGLDRLPDDGEVYLSPALADLLASPEGELLRPRFPWTVAGTIGQEGLAGPHELRYYAGADLSGQAGGSGDVFVVAGFGGEIPRSGLVQAEMLLGLGAGLLLLIPVFSLVGAATRVAAAARERRLAALRLTGADAGQTARIASGEALAGSIAGLLVGGVIFLATTPLAEHVTLFGYSAFREDLRPPAFIIVLTVIGVPALAVVAGLVALRHTVVHPLGTTRRAEPPRRRLWWRLVPLAVGLALLLPLAEAGTGEPSTVVETAVLTGLFLLGISVPLLLPWLLQAVSRLLAGGPPSWQLAVRRIQLDSGTPARAAAGIAAVLTGAVAVQTLLATALVDDERPDTSERDAVAVDAADAAPEDLDELDLAGIEGVRQAHTYQQTHADTATQTIIVRVADCTALAVDAELDDCSDGDVFVHGQAGPAPGDELAFSQWLPAEERQTEAGRWKVPDDAEPADIREGGPRQSTLAVRGIPVVLATPSAAGGIPSVVLETQARVIVDPADDDVVERLRNALVPVGEAHVNDPTVGVGGDSYIAQLRNAVLAGSIIVLVLAAASMLIVSIEQVRERRQQLAAMAAGGVGNRTLGGSVLWQALLPFAVAAVAAVAVGVTLASLFLRVVDIPIAIDWSGILVLVAACSGAVIVVTALTLPSLRAASRPESLRTE